jgi:hypothetical protein
MNPTFQPIIARWTDPNHRPLFKNALIDPSGCCCAQGDILRHECRMTDQELRDTVQSEADAKVAETLGISVFHSVLLRLVNDSQDGCPQNVLSAPEKFLGPNTALCLRFGRYMDRLTEEDWELVDALALENKEVYFQLEKAARRTIGDMPLAHLAANQAAWSNTPLPRMDMIAGYAMQEIQSGGPFVYLSFFGFNSPEEIPA